MPRLLLIEVGIAHVHFAAITTQMTGNKSPLECVEVRTGSTDPSE